MLIFLIGVDGSGKSTTANKLRRYFITNGYKTVIKHVNLTYLNFSYLFLSWCLRLIGKIVIFDRCFIDTLTFRNVVQHKIFFKFILKFLNFLYRPNYIFWLNVSYEEAIKRTNEITKERYDRCCLTYKEASKTLKIITLEADQNPDKIFNYIKNIISHE